MLVNDIAPLVLLYVIPVLPLKSVRAIPVASVNVNGSYLLVELLYFNTCPFAGAVVAMSLRLDTLNPAPISVMLALNVIVSVPAAVVISIPVPSVNVTVSAVESELTVVCPVTAMFLNAESTVPALLLPLAADATKSTFCTLP